MTLTNAQANFTQTLTTFEVDPEVFRTDCAPAQLTKVKDHAVCIADGAANLTVIQGLRGAVSVSRGSDSVASDRATPPHAENGDVSSSGGSGSGTTVSVATGAAVGVLAVALVAAFVYWRKHRRASGDESATNDLGSTDIHVASSIWPDPDLLAVKLNSDDIQDVKKLGSGAFCDVWLV